MQWYLSFSIVLIGSFLFGILFFIFLPSGRGPTAASFSPAGHREASSARWGSFWLIATPTRAGGKAVGFFKADDLRRPGRISIHVFNQAAGWRRQPGVEVVVM